MAGFFGVLILIWVVITYWWVIVGVGVAVGLFFGVRALIRREEERRLAAAREAEILAHRADRQHRWASRGDRRGIYGVEGAELMRSVSPEPAPPDAAADDDGPVAEIVYCAEDLDLLLAEKATAWPWAAFVSVLVQRLAEVRPRLRDLDLRYTPFCRMHMRNGHEVAVFVEMCMDEHYEIAAQLETFMGSPAFRGMCGDNSNESTADAYGIVHVANRLMDFHERFLELAERCRDVDVPSAYRGLLSDCSQLMRIPIDGYRAFIDEMVDTVGELPELLRYAPGDLDLGSVPLEIIAEDALIDRIAKQVRAARRS
ncbi:hypothetical protein K3G64_04955 [Mycobacterium sp. IDR2000157661]|nr:hypothetical protein K3G64_04955 [Mycobacterium sp. IDR2000157661]